MSDHKDDTTASELSETSVHGDAVYSDNVHSDQHESGLKQGAPASEDASEEQLQGQSSTDYFSPQEPAAKTFTPQQQDDVVGFASEVGQPDQTTVNPEPDTTHNEDSGSPLNTQAPPASSLTAALNNNNHSNTAETDIPRLDTAQQGSATPSSLLTTDVPATENIDPVASYSAWRKKKDTEMLQGTQAVMESFLKQHSAYDVLPVSYRQIVLDTTLLVKKALSVLMQYSIVSAPLWDSTKRKFAGMLTATDFINLIQFYYSHSSYTAAIHEMDQFQISQLRDVEKVIGVPPPELFSLHPLQSLYDACQLLVESRAHRLPLVDVDSETGEEMIVSVLTQYRILKFIAMNYQDEKTLRQPLSELKIGIYTDLAVADLSTPVMAVIDMFVKRRISSVPIVDDDGVVLNVFETVDVMTLVKAGVYRDLDLCVAEALLRRPEDFAGVHTCTLNDSLSSIFGTIRKSQVHRLIVVDSGNKLKGIVSLSDIMRYLIGGTREAKEPASGDVAVEGDRVEHAEEIKSTHSGDDDGETYGET
ncbi:AMP-activated serine/threonine-protein kinase regulatory subunit [Mortierella alpina]|nr:AMP-activated serine/threonine-protein kinase regulatory subunit [Mortierella alpina]